MHERPLAPTLPAQLAVRPGFADGFKALFQGFGFIAKTPPVWPLALVPMAVALGLTAGLSVLAIKLVPPLVHGWLPTSAAWLVTLVSVVATVLAALVAALVAFALAQPISGPALERIVRRAEALEGMPAWPPTSAIEDVGRSLQSVIVSYAFGLPILAFLFLINVAFPPATVVTVPLKLATTAVLLAWDFCDIPLSIRGVSVGLRVSFVKRNVAAMLGFGAGLALLTLVLPCSLLLVLPAGVAGGARLVARIERAEAAKGGV